MNNLNELERKYAELGAEIERLKRAEDVGIEYAFSVFVSNMFCEEKQSVVSSGMDSSIINKPRIILNRFGNDTGGAYSFARAYFVVDEIIVVANNNDHFENLHTMRDCETAPAPEVQAQHKEIIRKYLANRPKESRTFRIEDVDKAWSKWVESFEFDFEMVNSTDSDYINGKSYGVTDTVVRARDRRGGKSCIVADSTIKLSPSFYQALKPYLDLSKAL